MGKIIITTIITLLLVHSLALLGLMGYGYATGRFEPEWIGQYLATWRREKLAPPPVEVQKVEEKETPTQASARIAAAEIRRETDTRESQRDIELSRYMQNTVEQAKLKLEQDLQRLQIDKKILADKLAEYNGLVEQEGFQKALENYSQMKPKLVKDDFMQMDDNVVVRYLAEMKADVATKILEQFKTGEEQKKRLRLMELLENHRLIKLSDNK